MVGFFILTAMLTYHNQHIIAKLCHLNIMKPVHLYIQVRKLLL